MASLGRADNNGRLAADLLVIGGGMAGLTAGARAARGGAKVILVERAPVLGGSLTFASYVWTTPTFDGLRAVDPGGDPEMGRALVEGFADGVEWLRSTGVQLGPEQKTVPYGRGHAIDTNGYIRASQQILQAAGEFMPEEWGYPGAKIRDAIRAFNAAALEGLPLSPSRERDPRPLDEPPYYVLEAAPAITFTLGGLLIDRHARVRARQGGTVPGLLAAGADAGGTYVHSYAGGLALGLVFGLAAARTALAEPVMERQG